MLPHIWFSVLFIRAAFALQVPRQANTSYANASVFVNVTTSAVLGPVCCEVYAVGVGLNYWYTGHNVSINNGTLITEYLRYNSTFSQSVTTHAGIGPCLVSRHALLHYTKRVHISYKFFCCLTLKVADCPTAPDTVVPVSTITAGPSERLELGETYLRNDLLTIPGVPTDLNGLADYDGTVLELVNDTSTTVAPTTPFMKFTSFYVLPGHINNAGGCIGTNTRRQTYAISSVVQSWFFSYLAQDPHAPCFGLEVVPDYDQFEFDYTSKVSSQTSTWNNGVVVTEIDDAMFAWLTKQPSVLSQVPYIMSCLPASAAGAPQVHIPVSLLTASSAVTRTTNAIYFNTAATTSAVPASKTPSVVINTKAPTSNVPSPTTVEVSAETPSDVPAQPAESQKAGASSAVPSAGSENQPTQSTTVQAGASSSQPVPPTTAGAPPDAPSQQPAQPTVTQNAAAPSAAPADESTDKSAQPATSQGAPSGKPSQPPAQLTVTHDAATPSTAPAEKPSENPTQPAISQEVPSVVSSHEPSDHPDQTTTVQEGGQIGSTQADSNTRIVQSSVPTVVIIGDATATEISPTATPAEITTSNTRSHVVDVSTNTQLAQAPGTVVVGSSQSTSGANAYAIGSQTLRPGGPAIEVSGTTYSIQESGGVIVNGNTVPISTMAPQSLVPPASVVIGGVAATPIASDKYVIASQTLSRGGPAIEISGTTYSLPPSASNAIINGQAAPISTIQTSLGPPVTVVIGSVTAKPESSGAYYLVADQTLGPGGSAIEVSDVTYSLPTSGANIVINGCCGVW